MQKIALLGVPSSAGAHWPGQEKAPGYLRQEGLVKQLKSIDLDIIDFGDLPIARYKPDIENRNQQNLDKVIEVALNVGKIIELALKKNLIPIIIGGDCTIELGVITGFLQQNQDPGLIYFDGHIDLNTPETSPSGIFDSMGVAHMIGIPGSNDRLSHIGNRFPLLSEENITLFGFNVKESNSVELDTLAKLNSLKYAIDDVRKAPAEVSNYVCKFYENKNKKFIVHLDVDVIDFTDMPIADVPQFSAGLSFEKVIFCISIFASSPNFGGLVITEFNPDHVYDNGETTKRFLEGISGALA